jgi:hypothetical protein
MMKLSKLTAVALVAGAALAAQAGEQKSEPSVKPAPGAGEVRHVQQPESITKGDFVLRAVERFDAMDTNKDGVLTREEARKELRARMDERKKEFRLKHAEREKAEREKAERSAK